MGGECLDYTLGKMASDDAHMKKQTTAWLNGVPAHKKNPRKMQMIFVGGKAVFIPIF